MRRGVLAACKTFAVGAASKSAPAGVVNVRVFGSQSMVVARLSGAHPAMSLQSNQTRHFSQTTGASPTPPAAPAEPVAPATPAPPAAPAGQSTTAAGGARPPLPKLYVANLNWRTSSDDLHQLFSPFGKVLDSYIVMDRENPNRSRGFGFVTFSTMDEANKAIAALDQTVHLGRTIKVNISVPKPREERSQDYNRQG